MKGLNLSKLKKVSEDDQKAVFKHPDGHTVTIATKALSPKLRKELSELPKHMASGTDPSDPSDPANIALQSAGIAPAQDHGSFVAPSDNGQLAAQAPAPSQPAAQPVSSDDDQDSAGTESSQPNNQYEPSEEEQWSKAESSQPGGSQFVGPSQPAEIKADLQQQHAAFEQDLNDGHITPHTYADLFANKNTLGKVGTLFGLLVGGAGAGLTHQPNAILAMMNKELENDYNAQVQSKSNAMNFHKISQQGELQNAQIKKMGFENQLTASQAKGIDAESALKTFALGQAYTLQTGFHKLQQTVNNMPENQDKQAALQQLGYVYQKMGEKINAIDDHAAGSAALMNTMFGNQSGNPGAGSEQQFQQRQNMLPMLGPMGEQRQRFEGERHISGVPEVAGQLASRPVSESDQKRLEAMQVLSDKARDVLSFAKQHKGSIDPNTLQQGAQKAEEMLLFYNNTTANGQALTADRHQWLDKQIGKNPTTVFQDVLGNNAQLNEILNSNEGRKGTLLKNYGFNPKQSAPSSQGGGSEIRYDKQGNKWQLGPNGKPVKVK